MRILAFAASNSQNSINHALLAHCSQCFNASINARATIDLMRIHDYEMPIYSPEREAEHGILDAAKRFFEKIKHSDALMIAFAEYNGSFTSAYKNLFDWTSRVEQRLYQNKPTLIMAASPGGRGGANVLKHVTDLAPHFGMDLKGSLSIPHFYDVFDMDQGIPVQAELESAISDLIKRL